MSLKLRIFFGAFKLFRKIPKKKSRIRAFKDFNSKQTFKSVNKYFIFSSNGKKEINCISSLLDERCA